MSKANLKKTLLFIDDDKGGVIQIANVKGGVGKSTLATHLAACLARRGPTLLIDLDVQGSASSALGQDPGETTASSSQLFKKRFYPRSNEASGRFGHAMERISLGVKRFTFPGLVNEAPVTSLAVPVAPGLDLIPANADLYRCQDGKGLGNLIFNLAVCRDYYKYVLVDTPAVWNRMIQQLYKHSDLTLIPVTLNALSTKSLRDYVLQLNRMMQKNPLVNFRVVKNEVFGNSESKMIGKAKTMMVNREFLGAIVKSLSSVSPEGRFANPSSLVIDLEIPESAAIRSAQDRGQTLFQGEKSSPAQAAFTSLARQIQWILNEVPNDPKKRVPAPSPQWIKMTRFAKAAVFLCVLIWSQKIISNQAPNTPALSGQIEQASLQPIVHKFDGNSESLYRVAKFALCQYLAIVPSYQDVSGYINEVLAYHNSRIDPSKRIDDPDRIPNNTELVFYPPVKVKERAYEGQLSGFRYFMSLVEDPYPYITGVWADRGTGGGTPHAGIDVAGRLGNKVYSPVEGVAFLKNTSDGGNMVGIKFDNCILFFCHFDKRLVKEGQLVKKGQAVGTIGMTGRTSGPHVHIGYGIKYPRDGVSFGRDTYRLTDPMLWFYRQNYLDHARGETVAWTDG